MYPKRLVGELYCSGEATDVAMAATSLRLPLMASAALLPLPAPHVCPQKNACGGCDCAPRRPEEGRVGLLPPLPPWSVAQAGVDEEDAIACALVAAAYNAVLSYALRVRDEATSDLSASSCFRKMAGPIRSTS